MQQWGLKDIFIYFEDLDVRRVWHPAPEGRVLNARRVWHPAPEAKVLDAKHISNLDVLAPF